MWSSHGLGSQNDSKFSLKLHAFYSSMAHQSLRSCDFCTNKRDSVMFKEDTKNCLTGC